MGQVLVGLAALSLIPQIPNSYYVSTAYKMGAEHVGSGLLLDIDRIESLLSPDELSLVLSKSDPKKIIEMFAEKISGDYDHDYLEGETHLPSPRRVSTYFKGQSSKRGICRDKSLALAAILNHYGIKAEVYGFDGPADQNGHQFVYLPEMKSAIDPTEVHFQYKIIEAADYLKFYSDLGYSLNPKNIFTDSIQYVRERFQR